MRYILLAAFNRRFGAFMPVQAINEMQDEDIIESNRRAVLNGQIPKEQAERLTVYKVGYFDDSTGVIESIDPVNLCNLGAFLSREKQVVQEVKDDGTTEA